MRINGVSTPCSRFSMQMMRCSYCRFMETVPIRELPVFVGFQAFAFFKKRYSQDMSKDTTRQLLYGYG